MHHISGVQEQQSSEELVHEVLDVFFCEVLRDFGEGVPIVSRSLDADLFP